MTLKVRARDMTQESDEAPSLVERAARLMESVPSPAPAPAPAQTKAEADAAAKATATGTAAVNGHARGSTPGTPSPRLEVDLAGLKARGYLTPQTMGTHLAEEMRLIKRTVLHRFRERAETRQRTNMIQVTSAEPGAGKSFIALNLAMSLACELDLHVLLIDGDCWQPDVLARLGVEAEAGLLDALADPEMDLARVIHPTTVPRLSIMGAGARRQLTSELLGSDRMRRVAEELAGRYPDRLIIFDSSPLLAAAEAAVVAEIVGQILVVVEADKTERATLEEALDLLPPAAEPALVLNKGKARTGASQLYYHRYIK